MTSRDVKRARHLLCSPCYAVCELRCTRIAIDCIAYSRITGGTAMYCELRCTATGLSETVQGTD